MFEALARVIADLRQEETLARGRKRDIPMPRYLSAACSRS